MSFMKSLDGTAVETRLNHSPGKIRITESCDPDYPGIDIELSSSLMTTNQTKKSESTIYCKKCIPVYSKINKTKDVNYAKIKRKHSYV